jgi:TPR repeat protein
MHSPPPGRETLRRRALLGTTALFLIATAVSFAGQPAQAEFADGTLAYQEGDYARAYNEWLPLARAGNAAAQRNIGQLYRLGLGVPKDLKVAANWYRPAADQGLSRAQANLGVMYLRGEGLARDPAKAADWFNKAAEQGHVISQYNLALMLEQGYGVPRNTRQAAKWFAEASDGGHDKAGDRLAAILSETIVPAAGPPAEAVAPAEPVQTARSQDYLPTRILNRQKPTAAPAQVAAVETAEPTEPKAEAAPDRLTEALTAAPSPANIAGTPAARFAVRPEATSRSRVASLPETAPESAGLRRPAFLQKPTKAPRGDAPVNAALGGASEPRRIATVPQPRPAAPAQSTNVRPIIEVPVAPFLKAEAAAQRQPSPAAAPVRPAPIAPFLKAEAARVETTPPAVPVAPVQVAAVTAPPPPVLARRAPVAAALVVPKQPVDVAKPAPAFLAREALAPPPDLILAPRFGPQSYLVPRDVPAGLALAAAPEQPPAPAPLPQPRGTQLSLPLGDDRPRPTDRSDLPAFLVRESAAPKPADKPMPPARDVPVQVAALPEPSRDPAPPPREVLVTLAIGPRIPVYYLRQGAEELAAGRIGYVMTATPQPVQIAALTVPPAALPVVPLAPADKTPITAKPVPAFLQREAAGEHDDTEEPVVHLVPVAAPPRFLEEEAKTPALSAPAQTAAVQPKPVPDFLEEEAVPVLLRREAARTPVAPRIPAPAPSDTPESAAALPKATKPEASPGSKAEVPVFIREEAQTAALAVVDPPRVGDPVGRVKRVTGLLADADQAAKESASSAIPRYYQDRAALLAELEKAEDDPAPLPFLRRAPSRNHGAPIQPVPDLIVAEATRATQPVLPFLNEEAASNAADPVVPGTGETSAGRLAALPTSRQTPATTPPPRAAETAGDRQAVNAGVAAYLGRDYEKAIEFWRPAAARGNADAQFFVAGLYLDGNGVSRDLIQSHIWFARSAGQGHQRAREQLDLLRKIMTQAQFIEAEQRRTAE